MTNEQKQKTFNTIINNLHRHDLKKAHYSDIKKMIILYNSNNIKEMHTTKLYLNYGGLYCAILEILNRIQQAS